jgi:4-hydroxybenzoate polyprenyltransferase
MPILTGMREIDVITAKIRAAVRLGRPSDGLRAMLFFLLGVALVGDVSAAVILPVTSLLLLSMAVVAFNDVRDLPIDRISNPSRPLPSKQLSIGEALFVIGCYALLSLALMPTHLLGYWVILALLGLAYSFWRFSYDPLIAAVMLIFCNMLLPILSGETFVTHALPTNPSVFLYGTFFGLVSITVGPYKDFKDIEGDRQAGKRTLFTMFRSKDVILALTTASIAVLVALLFFLRTHMSIMVPSIIAALMLLTQLSMLRGKDIRQQVTMLIIEAHALLLWVLFKNF